MILFKNNSLAAILYSAKSEIYAMLLRLSNLSCVYLFVSGNLNQQADKDKQTDKCGQKNS